MRAAALAFTDHGMQVGKRLTSCFDEFSLERCAKGNLSAWTAEAFTGNDALIYIGAVGIAVRAIAPYIHKKTADPCVLVIDEQGKYVIPILSGHIGGGNALALKLAEILHALPVITTATDLNGLFAVDSWAVRNHLFVANSECIKLVSGRVLEGKSVSFYSDDVIFGTQPKYIVRQEKQPDFYIGYHAAPTEVLRLVPKNIAAGIGCRKGISQTAVEAAFRQACLDAALPEECITAVASIDLKKDEQGLKDFCLSRGLPFLTFSSGILAEVEGSFSPSSFVQSVTGVDNVCERSAVKLSGGRLLFSKKAYNGVTVAFAAAWPVISWEE